jgi:hypothetical protein
MCHLPNRLDILRDWQRVTAPGHGSSSPTRRWSPVSSQTPSSQIEADRDLRLLRRVANEKFLARAGFDVSRSEDLTENMAAMAGRWHDARAKFREDLLADEGEATFEGIQRFLAASHILARERRLSRYAYLARHP